MCQNQGLSPYICWTPDSVFFLPHPGRRGGRTHLAPQAGGNVQPAGHSELLGVSDRTEGILGDVILWKGSGHLFARSKFLWTEGRAGGGVLVSHVAGALLGTGEAPVPRVLAGPKVGPGLLGRHPPPPQPRAPTLHDVVSLDAGLPSEGPHTSRKRPWMQTLPLSPCGSGHPSRPCFHLPTPPTPL